MAINVRDEHLEQKIDAERDFRGDSTKTKTLSDLARERLADLERQRRDSEALDHSRMTSEGGREPIKAPSS